MSDLVERLRLYAKEADLPVIQDAADRIKELEKSLTLCSTHCEWQAKRIEVLEGALRVLANHPWMTTEENHQYAEIARAALHPTGETEEKIDIVAGTGRVECNDP